MGRSLRIFSHLPRALPIVVAVLGASGSAAAADPPPPANGAAQGSGGDAQSHFQRALELYQEQDFAGALVEFRRAQELAPTYKLSYNVGQVCYQLADYACALRSFESYLKEGGSAVSSERRAEVERELQKLRLRVGHLEIVTNLPGVEITIDDVAVGKTPLPGSVIVGTGKRRVSGSHEGYAPVTRIVEVAGTDSSRVELTFVSAGNGSEGGQKRYASRWNTLSWIGLGATVAFGAGSGIFGALALDAESDLESQRFASGRGPSSEMRSTRDRAETFAVLSDVSLGLSAVSLVGTLLYTFLHSPAAIEEPSAPSSPETKASKAAKNQRTMTVGVSGNGAIVMGSF